MNWRRWLALLFLCVCASQVLADTDILAAVSGRLVTGAQLQGQFEQEKSLPFLSRPLLSSGEFSLASGAGLRWRVEEPVVSEMTVTDAGVQLDGRAVKDRGVGELIAGLMAAFMTGDLSGLRQMFAVTGALNEQGWELELVPKSPLMQAALTGIQVQGDAFLQRVEVNEAGGGVTLIRLLAVAVADAVAMPDDAAR